jgi:putative PIN family toxin of toxin-antitoxin system
VRVIIDANVAIAGAASRGLCEAIMELCLEHHRIVLCEGILKEIEEKLRFKLRVPPAIVAEYVRGLRNSAEIFEPEPVDMGICRDPDDLMILGLVYPANADVIITGDKDLLVITEYKGARILNPRSFWDSNTKDK